MKSAVIAAALVYLVSLVAADEPTTLGVGIASGLRGADAGVITNTIDAQNNNVLVSKSTIVLSKSDRAQLAKIIKELLVSHPETNQVASNLILEQLEPNGGSSTITNVATNPAVVSHAINILASVAREDPASAAAHTVGLIGAAYPVVMAPPPRPAATAYIPSRTFTLSPSALGIPPRPTPRLFTNPPTSDD